jgi:hypothetical protein
VIFLLGSGTILDPYQIVTASDLDSIRNNLTANYKQMNDIDLSGYANWVPIGYIDETSSDSLLGNYDGSNFSITGLTINRPTTDNVGLFSNIGDYLCVSLYEIKNINIENANLTGLERVGALTGYANAKITNCKSSGVVNGFCEVGGLIGKTNEQRNSYEDHLYDLIECSSSCDVSGIGNQEYYEWYYYYIGGLVGHLGNYHTEKCFATGDVIVSINDYGSDTIGGFAGHIYNYVNVQIVVKNCYSMGNVHGSDTIGGFAGFARSAAITNCYSVGSVLSEPYEDIGGFVAYIYDVVITSCYYDSQISGQSDNDGRGIPKTTVEMKIIETFIDWDFIAIWVLGSSNNGYPCFGLSQLSVNINGVWKSATPYINVNGIWKSPTIKSNINNVWK